MPAPVAGIHDFTSCKQDLDGRDEPGHDGRMAVRQTTPSRARPAAAETPADASRSRRPRAGRVAAPAAAGGVAAHLRCASPARRLALERARSDLVCARAFDLTTC